MKIIVAPNSFKGSIDAVEICNIAKKVLDNEHFEVFTFPMSDGGDGFLKIINFYLKGELKRIKVTKIDGKNSLIPYLLKNNTVFIESSSIFGMKLLKGVLYPYSKRTTRGLGEAILKLYKNGYKRFIIGIGGTATVDAGIGVIKGAGGKIFDEKGNSLSGTMLDFLKIKDIEFNTIDDLKIECWCDVKNSLLGRKNGIEVYSLQKGVKRKDILKFLKAAYKFTEITQRKRNINVGNISYTGAGGGIPAAMKGWFNAKLKSGAEEIIKISGIENKIKNANVLITGEGMLDKQIVFGKLPYRILKLAKKYRVFVIGIAGSISQYKWLKNIGFDVLISIAQGPTSLVNSIKRADKYLVYTFENIKKFLKFSLNFKN